MTTAAAPSAIAVTKLLDSVMRADRGRLLSVLATGLRDISLAEEVLQEAAVSAMSHWSRSGLPQSPQGWLLTVARRKALDRLRQSKRAAEHHGELIEDLMTQDDERSPSFGDERLKLIFTCCHPALEMKSRVALTLRTVCGLSTPEIARAFLDNEPTMGQRLSRAKAKIAAAGIPFSIPEEGDWQERINAVLTAVYLIFTTGYVAAHADADRDLCLEGEFLMRLLNELHPSDPEIEGALAMMLLTAARRTARTDAEGASVPPADQNRNLWDHARIAEGRALLTAAVARRRPGPFQIKAAIADCQMADDGPDWPQIAALYGALLQFEPTPVVELNAAVAVAEAGDPKTALKTIERLADQLSAFQPWHAAHAAVLAMLGHREAAAAAYRSAIAMAPGQAEIRFLQKKIDALDPYGFGCCPDDFGEWRARNDSNVRPSDS